MLRTTLSALRSRTPVALFNMKHFQCKKKVRVAPTDVADTFATYLHPKDRLLRQSSAGAGSARVLVLDRFQCVKAVYYPTLCLPHPTVIPGGDTPLGLSVEDYLAYLKSGSRHPKTTLCVVSHQHGLGIATFDATGKPRLPLINLHGDTANKPAEEIEESLHAEATSSIDIDLVNDFLTVIEEYSDEYIKDCSTFFYVVRDKSCMSLGDLQSLASDQESDEPLPIAFNDKRWVVLPEQSLQYNTKEIPLYSRGENNEKEISEKGLLNAVSSGVLELDRLPRSESEDGSTTPTTNGKENTRQ